MPLFPYLTFYHVACKAVLYDGVSTHFSDERSPACFCPHNIASAGNLANNLTIKI
ncbi:hypothetical protein H1Q63_22205 [Desmonostoc muscorum CCALA 125]|nr:hypothetical protein [Desmonostoc muscorum CCALA 125]